MASTFTWTPTTSAEHAIRAAGTDALQARLGCGMVLKDEALKISWELKMRGEKPRWPFKRARQRGWNRA